ncbi:TPA: hypothetical protein ACXIGC_001218 [Stenotrophomonas maltophilia]|uniref:tetratricopeptide repeat protein n=1 Tax=Stenotrophomonas maltophilia TaxID=40324 RepID=UPI000C148F26|nr:tetratricopeptide repeat protein [Stenotrophomonas maltophilia]HEL5579506.1 sel1 repeat family protein [Stenotrophomonas maltophilia]
MPRFIKTAVCAVLASISFASLANQPQQSNYLVERAMRLDALALSSLSELPKPGDPDALVAKGFLLEHGIGVARDIHQAIASYAQACSVDGRKGCAKAAYFYEFGVGVSQDAGQAGRYVRLISKDGIEDPGELERQRRIVYKGLAEAQTDVEMRLPVIDYLERYVGSASSDDRALMERLGFGKRDVLRLARFWAEQDNDPEMLRLVGGFYNRSYADVDDKDAVALKWWRRAAEAGDAVSQNLLGLAYREGRWGLDPDSQQAVAWFERAAEQGDQDSLENLGEIYYLGETVPVDYAKAQSLFEQAAQEDSPRALRFLSWMHYNGQGVPVNCPKALQYRQAQRNQRVDSEGDAAFLAHCNRDQETRSVVSGSPPTLRLEHVSTFHGGRGGRLACEPHFVVSTDKLGEIADLRLTLVLSSNEGRQMRQTLAFSPFGLNTMEEGLDGRETDPFRSSALLPMKSQEFCSFRAHFQIVHATASVNGQSVDLLKNGWLKQ